MLNKVISFFDQAMRRYTPDPFLLALLLTFTIFGLGLISTPANSFEMIRYWGDGFWALIPFTLQMVMILVGGYVVAMAPAVQKMLTYIAKSIRSPSRAVITITLVSLTASALNWGLGLVIGGLLCREIARHVPRVNFRLLVAASYSGFLVWHGGVSGSIPLAIATPGNFSVDLIGYMIPTTETLLSPLNLAAVASLFIILPIANWVLGRVNVEQESEFVPPTEPEKISKSEGELVPYERMENSRFISLIVAFLGFAYLTLKVIDGEFSFNLNSLNFIFLFLAILLHRSPREFLDAITDAAKTVGPIILQFPFYAGLMGMIMSSNLSEVIANAFISISTPGTFLLNTFYSAGLLNLFIPSGGGQWAVQAPIVIQSAQEFGIDVGKAAMAVAWGDAWTNLLQPFWALPLLAIAGLSLRDIMSYCVSILIVSGIVLSVIFLIFA